MSSIETMSTWPTLVQSVSALPARYAGAFPQYTGKTDCSSMYAVYSPLLEFLWYRKGGQFLCIDGNTLHFFRPAGPGVAHTAIRPQDVSYIYLKTCLLSSELELGVKNGDSAEKLRAEYNTVREELYEPVLDFLRGPKRDHASLIRERDEKYIHLLHENFKLLNMGLHAYDRTCGSVSHFLQGPIRLKRRWFKKTVTSGILFIETENEFIAVEDIEHGTGYFYMRKAAVRDIKTADISEEGYKKLTVEFDGCSLSFPFTAENETRLREMLSINC
jgi:hypothetical protein